MDDLSKAVQVCAQATSDPMPGLYVAFSYAQGTMMMVSDTVLTSSDCSTIADSVDPSKYLSEVKDVLKKRERKKGRMPDAPVITVLNLMWVRE